MRFAQLPVLTQTPSTVAPGEVVLGTITLCFNLEGVSDIVLAPIPSNAKQSVLYYNGREFHIALSVAKLNKVLVG
jgi:hypothetical protein